MATWFHKELGDGMMAVEPSQQICDGFLPFFNSAGKAVEMAVFTRHESEGRLHCEVVAYFSPAAFELASALDADPCEKPARSGLGLLAGDESCWDVLFPESES